MEHLSIHTRSFEFALKIVGLVKLLHNQEKEYIISRQLARSGTAIGALIRESKFAESKADFIHKLMVALKESNETEYWLRLLIGGKYVSEQEVMPLCKEVNELTAILVTIVKKMKANPANPVISDPSKKH
ncbi:MAG: four helix bundle protein [Bacteroidota bacterium]